MEKITRKSLPPVATFQLNLQVFSLHRAYFRTGLSARLLILRMVRQKLRIFVTGTARIGDAASVTFVPPRHFRKRTQSFRLGLLFLSAKQKIIVIRETTLSN